MALRVVVVQDGDKQRLPGDPGLTDLCRVDRETARRRYQARAASRHPGHFDSTRSADEVWNVEVSEPVAGGWPILEVDTTGPTDIPQLARQVRALRS